MEKVSIIIPAYNCEKTIKRAIDSVLNQTYKNIELIIINDGSVDKTKQICQDYKDSRLVLKNIKNKGVSNARNVGIKISSGKYIMFLDSDDFYEKNMVEDMLNYLLAKNSDLVCCNYNFYKQNKKIKNDDETLSYTTFDIYSYIKNIHKKNNFNLVWSKIYKKEIIDKNSISFDSTLSMAEDYLFNINYFSCIKSASYLNEALYNYLITDGSLTTKYNEKDFERRLYINNKVMNIFIQKNFPLEFAERPYIINIILEIEKVLLNKKCQKTFQEKIKIIKKHINEKNTSKIIKLGKKYDFNFYQKICYFFIKHNNAYCLYIFISLKMKLKGVKHESRNCNNNR